MIDAFREVLDLLIGPYGVVVAEGVAIVFLWRLFREATAQAQKAQLHTGEVTGALKALTDEFKQWRESYRDFMLGMVGMRNRPQDEEGA